mgnify:CR=1 FL=1|jgi:hypothetical protein
MALKYIPLSAIPYQIVSEVINGQNCRITVRQMGTRLFTSLMVDGVEVANNVAARNGQSIVPWTQITALTKIWWEDMQGDEPPQYEGLADRWRLVYEEADDE